MPVKRNLPQTFPHRVIFVASITLCFCALGGILIAALSWIHHVWGYYMSTGFWSGGVILLAGIFGIVASYVRNAFSVKTFLILAIFGLIVSLAMIALSCGGLDPDSGFYVGQPTNTLLHYVCHGAYLGIGCLQLAICILCDAICIYYLFVERHAEIYSITLRSKGKPLKRSRPKSKDSTRESTASTAPLVGSGSTKSKIGSRNSKKRKTMEVPVAEDDESDMPIFRNRGSFIKSQNGFDKSTPIRTPCVRPASFTTFGRGIGEGSERTSFLVNPDEFYNVPDPNRYFSDTDSSHYAQSPLFCQPIPIEEDEELPPYIHEQYSPTHGQDLSNVQHRSSFQMRRPNSAQIQAKRRNYLSNPQVLPHNAAIVVPFPAQTQTTPEHDQTAFSKYIIDRPDLSTRLSQSEDKIHDAVILRESNAAYHDQFQGVQTRDFSSSYDKLLNSDKAMNEFRAHSVRNFKDPRLNRRRRARSVELRPMKGHYVIAGSGYDDGEILHPDYDSSSAILTQTKTLPTKFSVRTRMTNGKSRNKVVKSLSSLPTFSPPAKPPRTHSVKLEDLLETIDNLPEETATEAKNKPNILEMNPVVTKNVEQHKTAIDINPMQAELMKDLNKRLSQKKKTHDYATLEEMKHMKSSGNEIKPNTNVPTSSAPQPIANANLTSYPPPPKVTYVKQIVNISRPVKPVQMEEDEVFLPPKVEAKPTNDFDIRPPKTELKEKNNNNILAPTIKKADVDSRKKQSYENILNTGSEVTVTLPKSQNNEPVKVQENDSVKRPANQNIDTEPKHSISSVMSLPTSPVIIQPPAPKRTSSTMEETSNRSSAPISYPEIVTVDLRQKPEQTRPNSAVSVKGDKKPPTVKPKPQVYRLSTNTANIIDKNVSRRPSDRAHSMELSKGTNLPPHSTNYSNRVSDSNIGSRPLLIPSSEGLLQKKDDHPVTNTQASKPTSPSSPSRNLFLPSDEHTGARPKSTSYRRSNSEDPDERPIRPLVRDGANRPASFHTSKVNQAQSPSLLPQPYHSKPKFSFSYPTSPTSPVSPGSTSFASNNKNMSSPKEYNNKQNSTNSTESVPRANVNTNNAVAGTGSTVHTNDGTASPHQQAVSAAPPGAEAAPQPRQQPAPLPDENEDPEGDKPFFSQVL